MALDYKLRSDFISQPLKIVKIRENFPPETHTRKDSNRFWPDLQPGTICCNMAENHLFPRKS
jgi:hypothetical protein